MKKKPTYPRIFNRKAKFDYVLIDSWIAGIQLTGTEVKSLREGRANLTDAYCYIQNGECFLKEMDISQGTTKSYQHEPRRIRKLLLRKSEINKIERSLDTGLTIIPTVVFLKGSYWKIEINIAQGKKLWDKRACIKERDLNREQKREDENR